jgi:hypothetical protein
MRRQALLKLLFGILQIVLIDKTLGQLQRSKRAIGVFAISRNFSAASALPACLI